MEIKFKLTKKETNLVGHSVLLNLDFIGFIICTQIFQLTQIPDKFASRRRIHDVSTIVLCNHFDFVKMMMRANRTFFFF